MRNKVALNLRVVLAGLLLIAAQVARAQQASSNDSLNRPVEVKCQTPVTVTGAVVAPGRIEVRRPLRLLELLASAGGFTERAGKTVEITRATLGQNCNRLTPADPNYKTGRIEIYDLPEVKRGSKNANPYLQPGDTVMVSSIGIAYVMGSVTSPQAILLKEPTTSAQAIALAGGALPDSMLNRVRIMRGCDSAMKVIVVDLKAVHKGLVTDVLIQPYDIVFVPGKRVYVGPPLCRSIIPGPVVLPLRVIY
ncbi:MAG: polysaccharide biosynthesis/export protein [Acidobacteriota bacterium]|nr:polysaccharide biosynthesis/export protein [Acidobacteriota bacterium]